MGWDDGENAHLRATFARHYRGNVEKSLEGGQSGSHDPGAGAAAVDDAVDDARVGYPRAARLTAETTARSDAVVMDVAMPTPHTVCPPTEASTYAAACAPSPDDIACSE